MPPRKPNCCVGALTQDGGCQTDGVQSQQGRGPHGFGQSPPQNLTCWGPGTPFRDIRRVSAFDVKRNKSSSLEGGRSVTQQTGAQEEALPTEASRLALRPGDSGAQAAVRAELLPPQPPPQTEPHGLGGGASARTCSALPSPRGAASWEHPADEAENTSGQERVVCSTEDRNQLRRKTFMRCHLGFRTLIFCPSARGRRTAH